MCGILCLVTGAFFSDDIEIQFDFKDTSFVEDTDLARKITTDDFKRSLNSRGPDSMSTVNVSGLF